MSTSFGTAEINYNNKFGFHFHRYTTYRFIVGHSFCYIIYLRFIMYSLWLDTNYFLIGVSHFLMYTVSALFNDALCIGISLMIRCYLAKISQKHYIWHWFQYRNSYFEHPSVSENGAGSAKMACCLTHSKSLNGCGPRFCKLHILLNVHIYDDKQGQYLSVTEIASISYQNIDVTSCTHPQR